jgi:hypothetical protein
MAIPNPNLIYRTDQSGSLTYAQLDGNFAYLSQSIASLESFSSSLDATFATEAELNLATSSLSSSFAGEIDGLASADEQTIELDTLNNVIRLKETVAAPDSGIRTFEGNVTITGSLNILDSITGSLIQVTNVQGTGSLYLKPDGSDIAERQFEIYNTAPSDIHFKGSATHSFFGDDTNYLKIDDSAATVTIDSTNGLFIETDTTINSILQLQLRTTNPPTSSEGMIMASGSAGSSALYYYNGTTWVDLTA